MKKSVTIVTKEYDKEGNLKTEITETSVEEDTGYIYPQISPYSYPVVPTIYKNESVS